MTYRTLGKNLTVSAVGLGCMGFSHAYGAPADKNEMRELLAQAVDIGCNFFDTAEALDKNQALLNLLENLAARKGATKVQISLACMIDKKTYIVPIPGTRKLSRLKENVGAADVNLTAAEVKALDDALDNMEMSAVYDGTQVKTR